MRHAGKPEKSGLIAYAEIKGRCGGAKGCREWGISADRLTRAGLNDRTASAQTGRRYSLLPYKNIGKPRVSRFYQITPRQYGESLLGMRLTGIYLQMPICTVSFTHPVTMNSTCLLPPHQSLMPISGIGKATIQAFCQIFGFVTLQVFLRLFLTPEVRLSVRTVIPEQRPTVTPEQRMV